MKKGILVFSQFIFYIIINQFAQSQNFPTTAYETDEDNWMQIGNIDMSNVKETYQEDSLEFEKIQRKITEIKYQISQDKKNDPLSKPKDPFETTDEYNQRLKALDDKYNTLLAQKTELIDQQVNSFQNVNYMRISNVNIYFSLDKYDADHSSWLAEISDNGVKKNVSINIDPNQARLLWSNINQLKVYELKKPSHLNDRFLIIVYDKNVNPIQLQYFRGSANYGTYAENKVFTKVEVDASFPGGVGAWTRFLTNNLNSNLPAENKAKPGSYTVVVRFIVDKEGFISDVQAETTFGYGMEQEAIRVIKKSGRWTPAIQNGRNVTAYKRQPMTWIVSE